MVALEQPDETARLATLRRYGIVGTAPEDAFDRLTRLAASLLDTPVAFLTFVEASRVWIKSCFGLSIDELPREITFCTHAVRSDRLMVVPDARRDPRFVDSPFVTGPAGLRFYAGAPLVAPDRSRIGTICVLDRRPRRPSARQRQDLVDLAGLAIDQLELRRQTGERARAEAEAEAERARLASVIENLPFEFWLCDADGRCLLQSAKSRSALGRSDRQAAERIRCSGRRARPLDEQPGPAPRRRDRAHREQLPDRRAQRRRRGDPDAAARPRRADLRPCRHPCRHQRSQASRGAATGERGEARGGDREPAVRLLDLRRCRPLRDRELDDARPLGHVARQPARRDGPPARHRRALDGDQRAGAARRDGSLRGILRGRLDAAPCRDAARTGPERRPHHRPGRRQHRHHQAQAGGGADPAPRGPRSADRPAEPSPVPGAPRAGAVSPRRGGGRPWPSWHSISTTSRASTTRSATTRATGCSARWRDG